MVLGESGRRVFHEEWRASAKDLDQNELGVLEEKNISVVGESQQEEVRQEVMRGVQVGCAQNLCRAAKEFVDHCQSKWDIMEGLR